MADTREARARATEIKFVVDPALGARIREWSRTHLEPDLNGSGPFGDAYRTTSLYFDTPQRDVFHRRGSFGRAKYRIRRYDERDTVFLERKLRKPGMLVKRRTKVGIESLAHLDVPSEGEEWPGSWFERRIVARKLEPVCQLSYQRMARGVMAASGLARLTVDDAVHVTPIAEVRFSPEHGLPVLPDRVIVEMKFRAHLPAVFTRLVEEFGLSPKTASKYRLGMAAIGGFDLDDAAPADALDQDARV